MSDCGEILELRAVRTGGAAAAAGEDHGHPSHGAQLQQPGVSVKGGCAFRADGDFSYVAWIVTYGERAGLAE